MKNAALIALQQHEEKAAYETYLTCVQMSMQTLDKCLYTEVNKGYEDWNTQYLAEVHCIHQRKKLEALSRNHDLLSRN